MVVVAARPRSLFSGQSTKLNVHFRIYFALISSLFLRAFTDSGTDLFLVEAILTLVEQQQRRRRSSHHPPIDYPVKTSFAIEQREKSGKNSERMRDRYPRKSLSPPRFHEIFLRKITSCSCRCAELGAKNKFRATNTEHNLFLNRSPPRANCTNANREDANFRYE